jgi:endonuclease YncB( thermonuclease family)
MQAANMKRLVRLSPTAIFLLFLFLACSTALHAAQYKCTRVIDGDTITVNQNGFKSTIRLVGIDAPEKYHGKHQPGQPFSQTSSKYLVSLVLDKYVDIVAYGTDRYGRILGIVYVDGKNVNLAMIKAGLAEVYRGKPAPGFDNGPYQKAEDEARRSSRGGDKYVSPKEWRKLHSLIRRFFYAAKT